MSSERPAVAVSGVSKSYVISHKAERATTLGEAVAQLFRQRSSSNQETLYALSDVSFEVHRGEVLGVIGPNGAGKSTLLKLLSGIMEPTSGEARVWGRVGSLLEVGTGFHPELTGRENVYLNGCILGMTRAEIDRRFPEIIAFSGVERFLDTPVKHYSSGMFVRLGFAVAAYMDPEILIVDEVLAVGDAEFQARCLGKMKEVAGKSDRTVLFVSHNLQAVRALCDRAIVLSEGRLVAEGDVERCVEAYLGAHREVSLGGRIGFERPPGASFWMTEARLEIDGVSSDVCPLGGSLSLVVEFEANTPVANPRLGFGINSSTAIEVLHANNRYQPTAEPLSAPASAGTFHCELGRVPLVPGHYTISFWLGDSIVDTHVVEHALAFRVIERDIWGLGGTPPPRPAALWWPTRFSIRPASRAEARASSQEQRTRNS
jgi:lipopolysaccharide transport system ATP-binding protein